MRVLEFDTVDDINPASPLRILNYENYGRFLIMGNAGFRPSTVSLAGVTLKILNAIAWRCLAR